MGNKSIVALLFAAAAGCSDSSSAITTAANQQAVTPDAAQVASNFLQGAKSVHRRVAPNTAPSSGITMAAKAQSSIDTLINFSSSFTTPGFDGLPVFSPDGKRLAWTTSRTPKKQAQIFLADWDDRAARGSPNCRTVWLGPDPAGPAGCAAGAGLPIGGTDVGVLTRA